MTTTITMIQVQQLENNKCNNDYNGKNGTTPIMNNDNGGSVCTCGLAAVRPQPPPRLLTLPVLLTAVRPQPPTDGQQRSVNSTAAVQQCSTAAQAGALRTPLDPPQLQILTIVLEPCKSSPAD